MGAHQAYSLPAPPPPSKSLADSLSAAYLTVEVSQPRASGDATAEPNTVLVPSWVLAPDPSKATHDCTITMEIGYVRKWFDFEKVTGAPINHICVPDPHYPFTPGGDGRQCRAVKTVAISPVKPGCEGEIQRKVVVWRELRTGNDLRRPDGTAFEDPDGFGTPEAFCEGDEGCFDLSGYSSGPVGSTGWDLGKLGVFGGVLG
ncbi:hypothetical protein KC332_g6987 [Hortaea werneckii]|nr:hypothetical protein KC350_g6146 [Hortaea werneckii]KAI6845906.1 hypothetical protein KC358_g3123 [Hortaea werneckii]KAI6931059.1 hypothetical protein KC341_g9838 [Hortaea werneckii]KAI6946230.1 hypothetical protein KC348_g3267 [Hortaea werneckii]KAI6978273.1 hypothetical protein KC321_g3006 [Hortaea werneckii]